MYIHTYTYINNKHSVLHAYNDKTCDQTARYNSFKKISLIASLKFNTQNHINVQGSTCNELKYN